MTGLSTAQQKKHQNDLPNKGFLHSIRVTAQRSLLFRPSSLFGNYQVSATVKEVLVLKKTSWGVRSRCPKVPGAGTKETLIYSVFPRYKDVLPFSMIAIH